MATVNLGSIKFKWKGTYAGGTAYTIDDVVSYNGSSYICIQASTGNLPTDTAYFEQMSQKGTDGTDGTDLGTILTTQGDILYRDGSGIQKLGAGVSGQVLQTGGTGANPSWATVGGDLSNSGASKNVYKDVLTSQVDINSNSFLDTGMSLSIPTLTSDTDFIVMFNENRKEQSWNITIGKHMYSTDNGSTFTDLAETYNYYDSNSGQYTDPNIYHNANGVYYLSFTSGQTPVFKVQGAKSGSSNNYRLNFAGTGGSTIVAIKVLP